MIIWVPRNHLQIRALGHNVLIDGGTASEELFEILSADRPDVVAHGLHVLQHLGWPMQGLESMCMSKSSGLTAGQTFWEPARLEFRFSGLE